jgi:hypothetical protein
MNKCECGQTFLFDQEFEHCALCKKPSLFGEHPNIEFKAPPIPLFDTWEESRLWEEGQRLALNT